MLEQAKKKKKLEEDLILLKNFWSSKIGTDTDKVQMAIIYGSIQTLISTVAFLGDGDFDLSILGIDFPEELKKEWCKLCETMKD